MQYGLITMFIFIQLMISVVSNDQGNAMRLAARTAATGDTMIIYRNYATMYAVANPSYTGTPSNATLAFPSWFVPPSYPSSVQTYIQTGNVYTYYTGPTVGVPGYLATKLQNAYEAGINKNGVLVSANLPQAATATISVPPAVPNGAVVLMP